MKDSDETQMKSGDLIPNLTGGRAQLPFANEHPCFGQRQGWCSNLAAWRFETPYLVLQFCDVCKPKVPDGEWTKLESRNAN